KADLAARRPKTAKLVEHEHLREYVQDKLSGVLRDENGDVVGPFASWKARSRSPTGYPSTSPTTSRCGSPTKRSISPSISKDAARWNGNWWHACAPGG